MSQNCIKRHISRLMALLMAAALIFVSVPAASAAETSGSCGADLSWSYEAGRLTITGSGDMTDFPESTMAPWYAWREEITQVILPEGLTSVGDLAFYQCDKLTWVTLPGSVTHIGDYAFADCTSLAQLVLPEGLTSIGRSAFECCGSLISLRLPSTLTTIAFQAFYRCGGLTTVSIPAGVTSLGMTAFAYCTSLVRAEINCPITEVPEWLFYGCVNLTTVVLPETVTGVESYAFKGCENLYYVEYDGSYALSEFIRGDILRDEPDAQVIVSSTGGGQNVSNRVTEEQEDGAYTTEVTTGIQNENVTAGSVTTDTHPADGGAGETSARVDATLDSQAGWEDVADLVQDAVDHSSKRTEGGSSASAVEVNVYLAGGVELTQDVLERFAGKNVRLNVHTQDGSAWTIDCSLLASGSVAGSIDLSYLLSVAEQSVLDELGCAAAYCLTFNADAEINAQVAVQLPVSHARQTATLYQRMGGKLELLQSVVVNDSGIASFWLAKVDADVEYFVAVNVPGQTAENAIVPESLKTIYGVDIEDSYPRYTITGRTSSWNMTLGQVTWILAGVMVGAVVIVGVVMFTLNKRKLRRGYVPELDDEEE